MAELVYKFGAVVDLIEMKALCGDILGLFGVNDAGKSVFLG